MILNDRNQQLATQPATQYSFLPEIAV